MGQTGPALLTAVISIMLCDYFFIPPYESFYIENFEYIFTLMCMLVVSQIICQLSVRIRRQNEVARLIESQASALYNLSRQMASTRGMEKLLSTGISYIGSIFDCEVLALMPEENKLVVLAKFRSNQTLDEKEQGVAQWVFEMGQMAGLGTDTLSFSDALYLPLKGSEGVLGVLRIHPVQSNRFALPEQLHLLEACANQIALAIEVDRLHDRTRM